MKNQQNSTPKRIKNKISILDRFWTALGWVLGGLGGVLGASWAALGNEKSGKKKPGPAWEREAREFGKAAEASKSQLKKDIVNATKTS